MKTNNYNLQILHHNEVFATRELALTYLNDFYKPNSLDAEPVFVKYGDTKNPDVILAFGTSDAAPGSFYVIDMTKANEQIEELIEKSDSSPKELENIAESLSEIVKAAGFDVDNNKIKDKITYKPDASDDVIGSAVTIAEAIDFLSKYTQKNFADNELSVEDTKSVRLVYSVNPDGGKTLKAEVIVSTDGDSDDLNFNNNIIGIKNDGVYAASNLSYDDVRHELIFTTSGYKNGRFQDDAIIQRVNLGEHTKLVADNEGHTVKLTIVENTTNYTTTLSADVQISSNEDNLVEVKDGKIFASKRAKDIKYGDSTVAAALTAQSNRINELNTKVESAAKTAHVEGGQTDTLETVVTTLADGGAKVTGNVRLGSSNSIIVKNGGLEANISVDIDTATNTLIVTIGNEKIVKTLPGVELFESAEYNDENEELIITFRTGNKITIPIHSIIHSWKTKNEQTSPVVLTKTVVTGGTDTLSGALKLRSTDNLLGIDSGNLYVSENKIDTKIATETTRATEAENALRTDIATLGNTVNTKFEGVEEEINDVKESVVTEKERATEAENEIKSIANHADKIAAEAKQLASEANATVAAVSEGLTETETKLEALTTIVNVNKADANAKIAETNANVSSNTSAISGLTSDLAEEKTERTNADTEIKGIIDTVKASVEAETQRAGAEEVALGKRIDYTEHLIQDESARAMTAEKANSDAIKELDEKIGKDSAETLVQAKAYTDSAVSVEENARKAKDVEIENSISNLETKVDTDIATAVRNASDDATAKANAAKLEANNYTDEKVREEKERAELAEKTNSDAISNLTTEVNKKVEKVELEGEGLQYTLKVDNVTVGTITIPKDQFFKDASYNTEDKSLTLVFFVTEEGETIEKTVRIDVSDLVDTYTAGNGLFVSDNKFEVRLNQETETYLTLNEDGLGLFGIDAALATKANITDFNELVEKVNIINGNAALEGSFAKGDADTLASAKTYTDSKVDEVDNSLVAEVERAKSSEKVNSDAIAILNGNEAQVGSVKNAVKIANDYTDEKVNDEKIARETAISNLTDIVNTKANANSVYTKDEIDNKRYLVSDDIADLATKNELNTVSEQLTQSITETNLEVAKKVEKVELVKGDTDLVYRLIVDGNEAGTLNIPEDQFLKSVDYNSTSKEITFVFKTSEGEKTTKINVSDLVDTYVAGNGLKLEDNKFSVVINEDSESYLQLTAEGLKVTGINTALASKANVGDSYTKEESDAKYITEHQSLVEYAKKTEVQTVDTKVETLTTKVNANESAITIINGNEATDGSIAKSLKDAKAYTDEKATELNSVVNTKANSSDVYTKTEIDNKGYITEHQDISGLATKESLQETDNKVAKNAADIAELNSTVNDIKFVTKESDTVNLTMDKQTGEEYRTLTADVKLKTIPTTENANIIKKDGNGLYATVAFNYDRASNKITFNDGNGEKVFELNNFGILQEAFYESATKSIVLIIKKDDESTKRLTIPVSDLVNTWSVENKADSPIVLEKVDGENGDVLSANVSILNDSHNLLVNQNGSLFVDADSNKHIALWGTEETTVQGVINILKERTDEIDEIKSDIADLQTDNQNIKVAIATYQTDLNNQKERLTNVENDITTINNRLDDYSLEVEKLKLHVDEFEAKIDAAVQSATNAENTVNQLKAQLGDLTNEKTVAERLAAIEKVIAELIDFGTYSEGGE